MILIHSLTETTKKMSGGELDRMLQSRERETETERVIRMSGRHLERLFKKNNSQLVLLVFAFV